MAPLDYLKTYYAWYVEKSQASGFFASFFGGNREEYAQKAEKLKIVINLLEPLSEPHQRYVLDCLTLKTAIVRAETTEGRKVSLETFDELISDAQKWIEYYKKKK